MFSDNALSPQFLFVATAAFIMLGVLSFLVYKTLTNRKNKTQLECMSGMLLGIHDAVLLIDRFGTIQYVNPAAEKIIKYQLRSAKGKKVYDIFDLVDPENYQPLEIFEEFPLNFSEEQNIECLLVPVTQSSLSVSLRLIPNREDEKYTLIIDDLTKSQALQSRLTYLETHDGLTRFLNRNSFTLKLKAALNESKYRDANHIYCHLSLDQFQWINDAVGHNASDGLIQGVADIIKNVLKETPELDMVRFGGDEFGFLIRNCTLKDGGALAASIRKRISTYQFVWYGVKYDITTSIGLVLVNKTAMNTSRIFSAGDAARRVAKSKGGNKIQAYRRDDSAIQKQRHHAVWATRLKKAFKDNKFRLFAQPIHPLEVTKFKGPYHHYEILIRLNDENGNPISPDEFIPAAEYYAMMPQLDKWVVRGVLSHLKEITQKIPLPVFSINLSGQSLDEEGFLNFVLKEINDSGVRPQMLCFEITETVAITNVNLAMNFIKTLKKLGCSFSLDDFGTGMSSFEYLKTLPVDYLKIDGSFIKDIVTDKVQKAMVQSINQVGHLMGIQVIAEYVENDQIIDELRDMHVDFGQGYGISRPMPLANAIRTHYLGPSAAAA